MALNRYKDMLAEVPTGQFYRAEGQVIPYRNKPTSMRFVTNSPSTEYRVLVNGNEHGFRTSDAKGEVSVDLYLDLGENEIVLYKANSTDKTIAYVTTRHSATLMASVAQSIEDIDKQTVQLRDDSILETSSAGMVEDVFGKNLNTLNPQDSVNQYSIEAYRDLLRNLRSAYRHYGATKDGLYRAVRAYTSITPLILNSQYGSAWILGKDFLDEGPVYSYVESTGALPNAVVGTNLYPGVHTVEYSAASGTPKFRLTNSHTSKPGEWTSAAATGSTFTIYDGVYTPPVVSEPGPFSMDATSNKLCIDLGNGPVTVTLQTGASVSVASVVSDINSAFSASAQYGTQVAYACNMDASANASGTYFCVSNPWSRRTALLSAGQNDALQVLFNLPNVSTTGSQDLPFIVDPIGGDRYLTLVSSASVPPASSSVTVAGSGLPHGWIVKDVAGDFTSSVQPILKHFGSDSYLVGGGSVVYVPISSKVLEYKQFTVRVSVWGGGTTVQADVTDVSFSFDGLDGTYIQTSTVSSGYVSPQTCMMRRYDAQMQIPSSATDVWVRITTSSASPKFRIDKINITVNDVWGLYTGSGTVPRTDSKVKQGQMVYVWSPQKLSDSEREQLGLDVTVYDRAQLCLADPQKGCSTYVEPGHIDTIMPSASWLEKFDVSEYDIDGKPKNIVGAYTNEHFILGEYTNLVVNTRIPTRYTYLAPIITSRITDYELIFSNTAPWVAGMLPVIDDRLNNTMLKLNAIPLTRDVWSVNGNGQVELSYEPNNNDGYFLTYDQLTRFTTDVLDLGGNFTDYIWFADAGVWLRPDITPSELDVTVGIEFDDNGSARLDMPSNSDNTACVLIEDSGLAKRTIPVSSITFPSPSVVSVNLREINRNAIYSLKYKHMVSMPGTAASFKLEIRSGATTDDLELAEWNEVVINQVVDGTKRYHQLRVTVYDIRDTSDVRISSVVLKGLNMYGTDGIVPALRSS